MISCLRCLALLGLVPALGCGHRPTPRPPAVPEVTVAVPIQKEVTDYEDFTGRVDAVIAVDVRSRVTGYLTKVYFQDGEMVKEGDLLYEIDPRPFQADVDRFKGHLERVIGRKLLLEKEVERFTKLVAKGAASQQDLDVYLGQQAENLGALAAGKAELARAQLFLGYCSIRSPIAGQISRTFFQIGNLASADQTVLTTIVSTEPMYAYFDMEEPTYLRVQKLISEGTLKELRNVAVKMGLADDVDRRFPLTGTLDFVNNQVDPTTGTITVRGVFPNPKQILKPGLFARVRVPIGPPHPGLLVAERAIGADQGQKFLYVLDEHNKVHYRRVKVGLMFDGLRAIDDGLKAGERVIVNGLQRARSGIEVKPEVVEMNSLAEPSR